MTLEFANRLNLLTGDNGLGKSFLLDVVWWSLTRRWPAEINTAMTGGQKALPADKSKKAEITFSFDSKIKKNVTYTSSFLKNEQAWTGKAGRPANPGLVLYAMSDGSFAVWDPHRNYWITRKGKDIQERVPAYVFAPSEVWGGLEGAVKGTWLCNGLIRDWAGWQKENGKTFELLKKVLEVLSPSKAEKLQPGRLTRISLDDARDVPTITMPYKQDVPVVHASSGMRRMMALAYFLVWAWEEHNKAAELIGDAPTKQITFLVDEIESHLHPRWQCCIVPALLSVMDTLTKKAVVQLVTATHSPLIMTSVEPSFDEKKDAWFDLDYVGSSVELTRREFEKMGTVGNWLTSAAFDQKSDRSPPYADLVEEASALFDREKPTKREIEAMHKRLVEALDPRDDFLFTWRAVCDKKGWLR